MRFAQRTVTVILATALALSGLVSRSFAVTDAEVGKAIDAIKQHLLSKQQPDGGWPDYEGERNVGGVTAICTLAMLVSGESMQHPKLAAAIENLRKVEMKGTYAVSIRAHTWSYLPDPFLPLLNQDAYWLQTASDNHSKKLFDYTQNPSGRIDHSVAQYGMLGLWQFSKRGGKVPQTFWRNIREHFIASQFPDGGWAYGPGKDPTIPMTLAGLTAQLVAQQELFRDQRNPDAGLTASIDKGMAWMDKHFNANTTMYGLYGLERVALASGTRYFNKQDWYQAGSARIVRDAGDGSVGDGGHGGSLVSTSFALMFLARGRVPVWINKLEIPGAKWNQHPNDLYFLNEFISNMREGEVNWQVVSVDANPIEWLSAPICYLSAADAVNLTDAQKKNLKTYIDYGGLLVCNPAGGSSLMNESVEKLIADLYPNYKLKPLEPTHPIYFVHNQIEDPRKAQILGVSNGARDLILVLGSDYGYTWQSDEKQSGVAWDIAANLFALATNKGVLENRLIPSITPRASRSSSGEFTIGKVKYEGNWNAEPAAWNALGNSLYNQTGINLKTDEVALSELGKSSLKLVHLAGTDVYKLTDADIAAIKDYTQKGGTILIETAGGIGEFTREVEKQLLEAFNSPIVPLSDADSLISGEGLANATDCSRVVWRWRTVQTMGVGTRPRVAAIMVNNRPAILLSHEDLSLGMLGLKHWHVLGYSPASARKLAANIILQARK